jgi:hypothetical protein
MTDMQRWASPIGEMTQAVNGRYVLASDAEAAIAAAVEDFRAAMSEGTWYQSGLENGYEQGQRDMLAKCIALIEESVPWSTENWIAVDERAAILSALRALGDGAK